MKPASSRRGLLLGGGAALLAGAAAPAIAQPVKDHAVFTEFSPASKKLKSGWNRRIFTDTDTRKGNAIQCDFTTGIVTVAPGAYHIAGHSIVAYGSSGNPPETTTIRSPASAGYCRLRASRPNDTTDPVGLRDLPNSDPSVICLGSPSSANLVPSVFDTFYETARTAELLLEHQSGSNPEEIYLRVFVENSKWHAMARISIRSL